MPTYIEVGRNFKLVYILDHPFIVPKQTPQVGDFHRFKGNGHLAFLEDGFHLLSGQAVACHPAGTVSQIGLHIVVQAMESGTCSL